MFEFCPLDGSPCFDPKLIKVLKFIGGKPMQIKICSGCVTPTTKNYLWANFLHAIFHNLNIDKIVPSEQLDEAINHIHDFEDLNTFLALVKKKQEMITEVAPCDSCGMTLGELFAIGRVGCPECYNTFRDQIQPVVKRVQNDAVAHVGKRPKKSSIANDVRKLEERMAAAVKDERYEDAATYRDQIKELKK